MNQPDYHLFVLGEGGQRADIPHAPGHADGRSPCGRCRQTCATCTTLRPPSAPRPAPARRPGPRVAPGHGRAGQALQTDIPRHLSSPDFRAQARAIEQTYEAQKKAFAVLEALPRPGSSGCSALTKTAGTWCSPSQAPAASP